MISYIYLITLCNSRLDKLKTITIDVQRLMCNILTTFYYHDKSKVKTTILDLQRLMCNIQLHFIIMTKAK